MNDKDESSDVSIMDITDLGKDANNLAVYNDNRVIYLLILKYYSIWEQIISVLLHLVLLL